MSSRYGPSARKIWSLANSGQSTELKASGNSGNWPTPPFTPAQLNAMTPIDLRDVNDLAILVGVSGVVTGTTPSLKVGLDLFDDQGNLYPNVAQTAAITAQGVAPPVSVGAHGATTAFVIFPAWGRVNWVITGTTPDFPGVEIELWAR